MSIFRRKKYPQMDIEGHLHCDDPYAIYDEVVTNVIRETRGMAHCDQWVLHAPTECEYCDGYPQLQQWRSTLGINYTGHSDADKLQCPAEIRRPLEKIERWYGNVKETPERKVEREEYYRRLDAELQKSFPDVDWDAL